jgi:hypothetical protein
MITNPAKHTKKARAKMIISPRREARFFLEKLAGHQGIWLEGGKLVRRAGSDSERRLDHSENPQACY